MLPLAAILPTNLLWYAFPLIVAISLVYAATKHERMKPILIHALETGIWMVGFLGVVFVTIALLSWGL